jgi:Regulator of volume decrease after cellular swelling
MSSLFVSSNTMKRARHQDGITEQVHQQQLEQGNLRSILTPSDDAGDVLGTWSNVELVIDDVSVGEGNLIVTSKYLQWQTMDQTRCFEVSIVHVVMFAISNESEKPHLYLQIQPLETKIPSSEYSKPDSKSVDLPHAEEIGLHVTDSSLLQNLFETLTKSMELNPVELEFDEDTGSNQEKGLAAWADLFQAASEHTSQEKI